jgi:hypothetical protein
VIARAGGGWLCMRSNLTGAGAPAFAEDCPVEGGRAFLKDARHGSSRGSLRSSSNVKFVGDTLFRVLAEQSVAEQRQPLFQEGELHLSQSTLQFECGVAERVCALPLKSILFVAEPVPCMVAPSEAAPRGLASVADSSLAGLEHLSKVTVVFQTQSGRQSAFKKRSKSALVREKKTVAPLQQTKSLARSI